MALYSTLQKFITKEGVPVEGASVNVKLSGGAVDAELFATRTGTAKSNPFLTMSNGEALCYVKAGSYDMTVTKGTDQIVFKGVEVGPVSNVGTFAEGGAITDPDQLVEDADGNKWMWTGNLNYTYAAGENPENNPEWVKYIGGKYASIIALLEQWGYSYKGTFAKGFTYSQEKDAGIDENGKAWIYVGAGAPNKVVTAGTVPSAPDYEQVTFNAASGVQSSTGNVQDFIDSFELKVFQSPTTSNTTLIESYTKQSNQAFEVRKTSDDTLATIYSDEAGTVEIVQNGVDNKSNASGEIVFYILNGDYYISSGSGLSNFRASGIYFSEFKKLLTVGSGGDYATLNEAIDFSLKIITTKNTPVEIKLLSGYVMSEQVDYDNCDFSNVEITSEDAEIAINRSSLTVKNGRWYSAFRFRKCTAPTINVLFSMDNSGSKLLKTGVYLINSNCMVGVGAGVKNAGERGADVTQDSTLVCPSSIFSGAGEMGLRVATGSRCFCQYADVSGAKYGASVGTGGNFSGANANLTNCSQVAITAQGGTTVAINNADLSGAGVNSIYSEYACVINANNATIGSATGNAIVVSAGCVLNIKGATINPPPTKIGVAVSAETGAVVNAESATITNHQFNLRARRGGKITAFSATLTGADASGVFATEGGEISADYANFRKGASDSPSDSLVLNGGTISAIGSTGGYSKTPNLLDNKGVIKTSDIIRASGIASIPSGATESTINHGLSVAPFEREVSTTPTNGMGVANKFWISEVNSTSFKIKVNVDPQSLATFSWQVEKKI